MPYFTVVIPLYNKAGFITRTIQNVLAQTFTDFEIIIINDASTDGSLDLVRTFTENRIRIIEHAINKGLSASRNTGIKAANANFVAFLDADDIWKPQFLEKIYSLIQNYPEAGLFATKYEEIYPGNIKIEHCFTVQTGIINDFFKSNLNQSVYYPSCLCAKKDVFDTVGFYDESITYGEDIDFNIRAHLEFKMAYCNEPLVQYTMQSENQITQSSVSNKIITDFDTYEAQNPDNHSLKRYLDFNRYVMAKHYKLSGDIYKFKKMIHGINRQNLNLKQNMLLLSPVTILKFIKKLKKVLQKKGLNPTTY